MMEQNNEKSPHVLDRRIEHLLLSTQLEESGTNKFIIYSILLICVITLYLLVWSCITELEEITIADGVVAPSTNVRSMQHLEGGLVAEIFFKNGDRVKKDEVIMKFASEPATSDLERLKSQQNSTAINLARLESFISGREVDYNYFLSSIRYPGVDDPKAIDSLIRYSLSYIKQQNMSLQNERDILLSQINKLELNLKSYDQQIELLESRIKINEEQNRMYEKLDAEHAISKITVLDSAQSLKEKNGQLLELKRARLETANNINETKEKLSNLTIDFKAKSLEELTKLTAELTDGEITIKKAADRVARLTVKAPAYGIINGLDLKPGSVVPPGQQIFEFVPLEGDLVGSIKVSTKDIGHIAINDPVKIKVASFDFSIYGKINGKVTKISAYTFSDPGNKEPYYKATVSLSKDYLGHDANLNKILPGMTITAEIITNKKSVINYLLKPIKKSLANAMRER